MDRFTITVQGWGNSAEAVKVFEQIKDLRCGRDHISAAMQFAAVGVESVILEEITQAANPPAGLRSSGR